MQAFQFPRSMFDKHETYKVSSSYPNVENDDGVSEYVFVCLESNLDFPELLLPEIQNTEHLKQFSLAAKQLLEMSNDFHCMIDEEGELVTPLGYAALIQKIVHCLVDFNLK